MIYFRNITHVKYFNKLKKHQFISLNKLILTNDLPIDAYIDNEFDEWLDSE